MRVFLAQARHHGASLREKRSGAFDVPALARSANANASREARELCSIEQSEMVKRSKRAKRYALARWKCSGIARRGRPFEQSELHLLGLCPSINLASR